jgi:hypothetical protein
MHYPLMPTPGGRPLFSEGSRFLAARSPFQSSISTGAADHGNASLPFDEAQHEKFVSFQALNSSNILALQIVTVVFSSVTVCCAFLAFYWFFRMRKKFRHRSIPVRSPSRFKWLISNVKTDHVAHHGRHNSFGIIPGLRRCRPRFERHHSYRSTVSDRRFLQSDGQ